MTVKIVEPSVDPLLGLNDNINPLDGGCKYSQ